MSDQQTPNRDNPDGGELDFTECVPPGESFTNQAGVTVENNGPYGNIYISNQAPTRIRVERKAKLRAYVLGPGSEVRILNHDPAYVHEITGTHGTVIFEGNGQATVTCHQAGSYPNIRVIGPQGSGFVGIVNSGTTTFSF
jgi:hypothetical protein